MAELLPRGMLERLRSSQETFDARLPGFASEIGQLIGVESRTSSPVRVARDRETCEAEGLRGLYPCGEGAGFAGGIVSPAFRPRRSGTPSRGRKTTSRRSGAVGADRVTDRRFPSYRSGVGVQWRASASRSAPSFPSLRRL